MGGRALSADLLHYIFGAASMHRWNDHLRTIDLTELDKQAHKAAVSWLLGKVEEDGGRRLDWDRIITGNLYSFIARLALTDLKPQLYHRISGEKPEQVNEYVLEDLLRNVPDAPGSFVDGLECYLVSDRTTTEDQISRAAHYLATRWEFRAIYPANREMYGIERTREEIDQQINQHADLAGVGMLTEDGGISGMLDLIGQLRFQKRWARTPRIPQTTVLGHSLMVAVMIQLSDMDIGAGGRQRYLDYHTALFHDLPEVLTKDVITPVKANVDGLPALLESYERELFESRIMPLIPEGWRDELRLMVYDPFSDLPGAPEAGRRGGDIKACDRLAAFMEAHISGRYGITSKTLRDGEREIGAILERGDDGIGARGLLADFRAMDI